jgi:hypothetical protein
VAVCYHIYLHRTSIQHGLVCQFALDILQRANDWYDFENGTMSDKGKNWDVLVIQGASGDLRARLWTTTREENGLCVIRARVTCVLSADSCSVFGIGWFCVRSHHRHPRHSDQINK